ncbi:MAG: serine hydrolase domain-containing protein [Phycisphaerales bacterium JB043]
MLNTSGFVRALRLLAVLCVCGPAFARAQEPEPERRRGDAAVDLDAQIRAYVRPYIETGNFSGSILVARDGRVLFESGFEQADREHGLANTPGTSFYLASASRVFTSCAIMLLVQEGKMRVEDTLAAYLPEWPRGDEITIHHLLTLSSGMPNINSLRGYSLWSRSKQTPSALVERFANLALEFEPGTRSVHSNSNYVVLALLIERVSGMSYGEFLRQRFFEPLGMARTSHDDDSEQAVSDLARGYAPRGYAELVPDPRANIQWSVKTGHASVYSSVIDLYRFDTMLREGSILSHESIEAMFTEHFPSNGYGWFVRGDAGERVISISGRSPGYGSTWIRGERDDVTVIVLGNIYNGVPVHIGNAILSMVRGEHPSPPSLSASPPPEALLSEIVGEYSFGSDFYRPNATVRFQNNGGHLFNNASWLIPIGDDSFVHRTYWSTLTFLRDDHERVDRVRYDDFIGTKQ